MNQGGKQLMPISWQLINIIRWAIAFTLVYLLIPVLLFPIRDSAILEKFFTRYIRMVALSIMIGYILVAIKLYEFLSLSFIFLILIIWVKVLDRNGRALQTTKDKIALGIYNFLDGLSHPYDLLKGKLSEGLSDFKISFKKFVTIPNVLQALLLMFVLAYSSYLRFYDTLEHAAPAMSDAYVTLAWMKYIDARILFHDGIYPQGFHIYLSILQKFAACDALYILKYTGPLNGVLTTLGIYFFVVKITGKKIPGIISAFILGVLSFKLPYEWERQAATNSQEFAMAFLFPAWYYAISFLQTRKKEYLWTAGASFAVIGFVHTLIFAFLCVGVACIIIPFMLLNFRQSMHPIGQLISIGVLAGVLAALPIPIASLLGKSFNSSSVDFLTSKLQMGIPTLTILDKLAFAGFILFLLLAALKRKSRVELVIPIFLFILGLASFSMYLFLGPITGNGVLVTRSGILWALLISVGIGLCGETILTLMSIKRNRSNIILVPIIVFAVMAWILSYVKPVPAQPYKMQYDAEINQYLRIAKDYNPSEWTLVSPEEGYDLALGKGWHIQLKDFLLWYNPQKSKLVRNVNGKEVPLITNDLFIFYQKKLFKVNMVEMQTILAERVKEYANLKQWVQQYCKSHNNLSIYYQDDDVVVYHIHQPKSQSDTFKDIWGPIN